MELTRDHSAITTHQILPPELDQLNPELIDRVLNDVVEDCQGIGWDSIVGLDEVKQLIQYNMVLPMHYPDIFKGIRAPAKGMLLFGPPGTGKTMIGRAVASNVQATFFSISASSLTSKYMGDSEMLVRTLFTLARCMQPSIIFIDEVDALLSSRQGDGGHDATRRMKNELLTQMEGCTTGNQHVMLIGATNVPQ
ncbi:hypothetical protein MMC16_007918, partial [Acarospora aff. strigata]|nr:hypothetical protein [Acarospora aff. strigata]